MILDGFFFIFPWAKALPTGRGSIYHVAPEHEDEIKPGDSFLFREHHAFSQSNPLKDVITQYPKGSTIFRYQTSPMESGWNASVSKKGLSRLQRRSQQPEVVWKRSDRNPLVAKATQVVKIRNVTLVDLKKVEE